MSEKNQSIPNGSKASGTAPFSGGVRESGATPPLGNGPSGTKTSETGNRNVKG